jgi:hypothetical protein
MKSEAQPEPATSPKVKRRWFQYSITSLLLLILVCGVVLAFVVNPARRQRRAVEFVEAVGGEVFYQSYYTGWVTPRDMLPVGGEWYIAVKQVELGDSAVTDTGMMHLQVLTGLEQLFLGCTQVSDVGLEHLKELTLLEKLFLGETQISDSGLESLKGLTAMKFMDLSYTQVSDAGLTHLRTLTRLKWLDLSGTQVTDAGLAHLKSLPTLEWIGLDATQVTDAGVAELRQALPNCKIEH